MWRGVLGVAAGVVGCSGEPVAVGEGGPFAMGTLEAVADQAGDWTGIEVVESHGAPVELSCGPRRTLLGEPEGEVCAGCELAFAVIEADAPEADGVCDPDRDGLLQAGSRLSFVPRRDEEGVGSLLVDGEELGAAVFDGVTLSWRRTLWAD